MALIRFVAAPLLAASLAAPACATRADPSDAKVAVPPPVYRSAFKDYRRPSHDKLDWRQANDRVGHIGGWREYAREAAAPAASAPAQHRHPVPR